MIDWRAIVITVVVMFIYIKIDRWIWPEGSPPFGIDE